MLGWILGEGLRCAGIEALMEGFSRQLVAAGVPVARAMISLRVLTATVIARSYIWQPVDGLTRATFDWAERDLGLYERSPFKVVHATGEWLELTLDETPDDAFGIVPELKAGGITHYVALPLAFTNGTVNVMSLATAREGGFSMEDLALVRSVLPAFTAAVELRALDAGIRDVLEIYVGREPAKRILSGTVHRGEVNRISSAIMFVDMRDFTRRTQTMHAEETAELLNRYYDCVVPHVEANAGSVLKFIGDGILAIFPDGEAGARGAAASALAAARGALGALPTFCADGRTPFEIGIALHHGSAAFGNVGSGERLDFTVVGRDVNLTDRIGRLNKTLGIPLLMSGDFAGVLDEPARSLGHHAVKSFDQSIEVFEPARPRPGHPGEGAAT